MLSRGGRQSPSPWCTAKGGSLLKAIASSLSHHIFYDCDIILTFLLEKGSCAHNEKCKNDVNTKGTSTRFGKLTHILPWCSLSMIHLQYHEYKSSCSWLQLRGYWWFVVLNYSPVLLRSSLTRNTALFRHIHTKNLVPLRRESSLKYILL